MLRTTVVLGLAFAGCSKSEPRSAPSAATTPEPKASSAAKDPAAARTLIAQGAVVLDVRTAEEYAEAHLPTATNIAVTDLPARMSEIDKLVGGDKTKPIVAYCASGKRSAKAKQLLEAAGYTRVVNGGGYGDLAD